MKNPKTGELREVKVGWSWVLFFFACWFGLPLFLRKLYLLGAVLLCWTLLSFTLNFVITASGMHPDDVGLLSFSLFTTTMAFNIWLAIKGNEYTAKNYLDLGWVFAQPDSLETQYALTKWKIEPSRQASRLKRVATHKAASQM